MPLTHDRSRLFEHSFSPDWNKIKLKKLLSSKKNRQCRDHVNVRFIRRETVVFVVTYKYIYYTLMLSRLRSTSRAQMSVVFMYI